MIYITRRERFNAAHMLWNYNWNEQKNIKVFGKCANKNWHGHNFELFVTVKGEVNEDTGDLTVLVSNENGRSHWGQILTKTEGDELKQTFLVKNEKSN